MKLRYTSLQADTGAAEEHGRRGRAASRARRWWRAASTARSRGVVACVRKSMARAGSPTVMTDGAALPHGPDLGPRGGHARRGASSTHGHLRPRLRRRLRGGQRPLGPGGGPPRSTPTWSSSGWARGWSGPEPRSAPRGGGGAVLDAAAGARGQPMRCLRVSDADQRPPPGAQPPQPHGVPRAGSDRRSPWPPIPRLADHPRHQVSRSSSPGPAGRAPAGRPAST